MGRDFMEPTDKKINQALKHALKDKKLALEQAYIQANKDTDRLKTIEEWETIGQQDWE